MNTRIRAVVMAIGLGVLGMANAGCELLVQLDRSLVDAGEDAGQAGCPICSDASQGGASGVEAGGSDGRTEQ
jgi:hypothetical protein